ncbi:hypothetical protein SAMN05428954_4894 [Streptomyces sp. 2112.3]|uniref:hypothetical protein n=1 Tax=Streptomyces sp. 2112.3 TaxID=1881023 RepID=UPI0008979D63|nr:hypothetical protein [Streptomyces sp. 2112.3]SEE97224.1 hypothetical protein SAMN05428954_4894 [Streptomyces sp. 2112.3]
MRTTAPAPELLADHTGKPRARFETDLTYEQTRLGLAFHEAGHAVLATAYGMHVESSEIIAWANEAGGVSVTGITTFQVHNPCPWRFAAQAAAGELAHVHHLLTYGLWTPERAVSCTADHDREHAVDVLAQSGFRLGRDHVPAGGKSWAMVRGMARRKVTHLWPEICAVAHAMDARDRLTGDEIAALTGLAQAPAAVEGEAA